MIRILEILSFAVSLAAFGYGAFHLFRKNTPKYFQLYVYAAGCYMLEELWVVVNSLLGNGIRGGLVTVRLLGFFGFLCFMLSANANQFDKIVSEAQSKKVKVEALTAPAVLILLYGLFAFSPANTGSTVNVIIGFIAVSPAFFASYFSLKHLLLPEDPIGLLRVTRGINVLALIIYAANCGYMLLHLYCPITVMCIYDLILAVLLFAIIAACKRGAEKWNTLI